MAKFWTTRAPRILRLFVTVAALSFLISMLMSSSKPGEDARIAAADAPAAPTGMQH